MLFCCSIKGSNTVVLCFFRVVVVFVIHTSSGFVDIASSNNSRGARRKKQSTKHRTGLSIISLCFVPQVCFLRACVCY